MQIIDSWLFIKLILNMHCSLGILILFLSLIILYFDMAVILYLAMNKTMEHGH